FSEKRPLYMLEELAAILRAENGCAWDREQTSRTLKPYLIEEAYEVYEAIEGRREKSECLFDGRGCGVPRCILGGLLGKVDAQIGRYLAATRISSLADLYAGDNGDEETHHKD
ncbi:MAG TPA: MazG nucleotide pyrophosphohydrolase domain-containing protein, partial [bacterium]|nr:MazG nucleotide pyrophosphohydrolase domain-containing protein [bacterium]